MDQNMLIDISKEEKMENPVIFEPPVWFDKSKFERAQKFGQKNFLSVCVGSLIGLMFIVSVKSIASILYFTRKSLTSRDAFRRYLSTLTHVKTWYYEDPWNSHSDAGKSLCAVRGMHAAAFEASRKAGVGDVSQFEMVVTHWAFFGPVIGNPYLLGIAMTKSEEEDFIYFWRCLGHLLGIKDKYNLCEGDVDAVKEKTNYIFRSYILPSYNNPTEVTLTLSKSLLEGCQKIVPFIIPDVFSVHGRKLVGLPIETRSFCKSWHEDMLNLQTLVLESWFHHPVLGSSIRTVANGLLHLAMYLCTNFQALEPIYLYIERPQAAIFITFLRIFSKIYVMSDHVISLIMSIHPKRKQQ